VAFEHAARPQPPEPPLQGLGCQHVQPPQGRCRHGAGEQGQGPLGVGAGRTRFAELHAGLAEQAMPAGPFQDRDALALQGGGQDGLGLAEPAPASVQRAEPDQVAIQPGWVGVPNQPVGGRPQVLDLGIKAAPSPAVASAGSGSNPA
jgi:hypothetical protein